MAKKIDWFKWLKKVVYWLCHITTGHKEPKD